MLSEQFFQKFDLSCLVSGRLSKPNRPDVRCQHAHLNPAVPTCTHHISTKNSSQQNLQLGIADVGETPIFLLGILRPPREVSGDEKLNGKHPASQRTASAISWKDAFSETV